MVTVAIDTDVEAARPFHEAAHPTHPALTDPGHTLVELLGFTNVPTAVWIDESGTIVRPGDQAYRAPAASPPAAGGAAQPQQQYVPPPEHREVLQTLASIIDRSGRYDDAIRDWAAHGAQSRYALSPEQVIERSRPRPPEVGMAAAEFELAQHLQRLGAGLDAVPHFKEAHRLDPREWTYLRQALAVADPAWGKVYERDMLSEVAAVGAGTFYAPLDL